MVLKTKHIYEFGSFRLDATERLLFEGEQPIQLPPKVIDTLLVLVERSGRLIEKDELMKEVWPDSFVEENNLNKNISALRKALGEGRDEQKYIETIPKRGYRFVTEVHEVWEEQTAAAEMVIERTRASVVIEEEDETDEPEGAGATIELPATERALLTAQQPQTQRPLRTKRRMAIIAACMVLAGLVVLIAAFFLLRGKSSATASTNAPVKVIAVLPFRPISSEGRDEYLELGMADALITKLSNVKQIIVRPTSAVRKYAGVDQNPVAAGRELRVGAVLEGNVQKIGDTLRVTVQLINVDDGSTFWAEKFDTKFTDIFAVEDAISEKVTGALALKLTGDERERLAKRQTINNEAYQLYQKARYFLENDSEDSRAKAVEYFQKAIEIDPSYALAYAGLSDSYVQLGRYARVLPEGALAKAKVAALKAVELDNTLGEAYNSLAFVRFHHDWDWQGAESDYKRALELNPNFAKAHDNYSLYLMAAGRTDQGLLEMQRAVEIDPLSMVNNSDLAIALMASHRYDDAIEQLRKNEELTPHHPLTRLLAGRTYILWGKYDEAIRAYESVQASEEYVGRTMGLVQAYALAGRRAEALKLLEELKARPKVQRISFFFLALTQTALGQRDEAFDSLEHAFAEHEQNLLYLKVEGRFDSLRSDPRFTDLMRRVGIPQ